MNRQRSPTHRRKCSENQNLLKNNDKQIMETILGFKSNVMVTIKQLKLKPAINRRNQENPQKTRENEKNSNVQRIDTQYFEKE